MRKSISQQSSSLLAIFAADERLFDLNTANIYNCPPAKVPPDSAQRQDLLRGIEPVFESVPRSGRLLRRSCDIWRYGPVSKNLRADLSRTRCDFSAGFGKLAILALERDKCTNSSCFAHSC